MLLGYPELSPLFILISLYCTYSFILAAIKVLLWAKLASLPFAVTEWPLVS